MVRLRFGRRFLMRRRILGLNVRGLRLWSYKRVVELGMLENQIGLFYFSFAFDFGCFVVNVPCQCIF